MRVEMWLGVGGRSPEREPVGRERMAGRLTEFELSRNVAAPTWRLGSCEPGIPFLTMHPVSVTRKLWKCC